MSEASVSVRLNPFKKPSGEIQILKNAVKVPWNEYGFILPERPVFTLDPLLHAGCYYVQDSSAMFVGYLFRKLLDRIETRGLRVLDLCAAPGGKTTDISSSLRERYGNDFLLVSNEVMKQRVSVLCDNVAKWGDPNVVVTSADPAVFGRCPGFFDIIVADVPCSGEGMFRKDQKAVEQWSEENVALCAARQKRILADVWPALKSGGYLIYSTCTYEKTENDDNLEWAASELGGEIITPENGFEDFGIQRTEHGSLLKAGVVPGEGQWAGALCKTSATSAGTADLQKLFDVVRPLRKGVRKGEMKGKDFVPDADWALCLDFDRNEFHCVEVDRLTALHFLHRDSLVIPDSKLGYNVLTYCGVPLGFVKNIGKRCNNLLPQGRRILMDII